MLAAAGNPFAPADVGRVYASDGDAGAVYVFPESGTHQQPLRHFGSFNSPTSLAIDGAGNLYVPDWGKGSYDGSVHLIARGRSEPFLTLNDTGALPSDLAVDAAGSVYVANGYDEKSCGGGGDVRVYLKGATTSAYTICDSVLGEPYSQVNGVAVDSKGDVYVTWQEGNNTHGRVREFTPGPHYTGQFLPPVFRDPSAVAVDAKGNVIVSDVAPQHPAVFVYTPGAKRLKYAFATKGDPLHVAFDPNERHIYVADALANEVDEYLYGSKTVVNTIAFPGQQLDGIALDSKAP